MITKDFQNFLLFISREHSFKNFSKNTNTTNVSTFFPVNKSPFFFVIYRIKN